MSFTSYSVDNDRKFREYLKDCAEATQDMRIPFGLISRDFYRSEQAIFKLRSPGQYPDFTQSKGESRYKKYKRAKYGFDYPLLLAKGRLAASVLGPRNPGSINVITPLSLIIGTSVKYGIYHQSDEPRSKIPLRKFLFIGPEAPQFANSDQQGRLQRWAGYIQDYYVKFFERRAAK